MLTLSYPHIGSDVQGRKVWTTKSCCLAMKVTIAIENFPLLSKIVGDLL